MFNTFKGFVSSEDGTFGEHIQQLGQPYHLKILWNSVILGISVVILCTIIALPLSYIMTKTSLSKHQWLDLVIMIPFMTPPYIGSMGWMLTMQRNGLLEQLSPIFSRVTPYFFSFWDGVDHELPLDTIFIYYFEKCTHDNSSITRRSS